MSSWLGVIFIGFIFIAVIYYYLRKNNKLPTFLSKLSYGNPQDTISKLQAATEQEQQKSEELRKILKAKEDLTRTKAVNSALRREIASIHESTIPVTRRDLLNEQKEKV